MSPSAAAGGSAMARAVWKSMQEQYAAVRALWEQQQALSEAVRRTQRSVGEQASASPPRQGETARLVDRIASLES